MKYYAAYYDNDIRIESSSGGVFSIFTTQFDVVYGVALTDDCYSAEFRRIDNGDIVALRGSKYFQAKMGDTFKLVKRDLVEGRKVLFTGTGCQVSGLISFLGEEISNLTTIDIICHGVPSPKLWEKYLRFQEESKGKIFNVNFRCKEKGWKNFGMRENQLYISKDEDPFMRMFLRDYCLRPSCYQCYFKKNKKSDISIGDFWGIEKVASDLDDNLGTSFVIVRSEKGQKVFDSVCDKLRWKEVSYEEGIRDNSAEVESVQRPIQRDSFFRDMNSMNFRKLKRKYVDDDILKKIKTKVKKIIRFGEN